MSRRNQSRRRQSYGRRQHEVRERRLDYRPDAGWTRDGDIELESEWQTTDVSDDRAFESFGSFGR